MLSYTFSKEKSRQETHNVMEILQFCFILEEAILNFLLLTTSLVTSDRDGLIYTKICDLVKCLRTKKNHRKTLLFN